MKDLYGREINYLRLSVTDRCNLRCRYCMPEEGICKKEHEFILNEEEMVNAVKAASMLGFRKVRLTGGEPLVRKDIIEIAEQTFATDGIEEVCITTNGILLPEFAVPLRKAGVTRANISLDTLDPQKYAYITRRGKLDDAMAGIEAALSAGFTKVKINTVLIGGFNDDEIADLAALTEKYPIELRFIELMPMNDFGFGREAFVPGSLVWERLGGVRENIKLISPISDSFCGKCNRIRITADGKVKPCLHSREELNIKGLGLEEMTDVLKEAIIGKPACHRELSADHFSDAERNMNQIGG